MNKDVFSQLLMKNDHVHMVLVCIGEFQEYILLNLTHLIQLGHTKITVITNGRFFEKFAKFMQDSSPIHLIDVDDENTIDFSSCSRSQQKIENHRKDKDFRNGFWIHTSMRFFYLYEFMKTHNIKDAVHIENDVLIYHNADVLLSLINQKNREPSPIYLPFDCYDRSIASIVYIPTHEILGKVLEHYDANKNDMENFAHIRKIHPEWIDTFPIFPLGLYPTVKEPFMEEYAETDEIKFTCRNYEQFGGFIFDAAAMGQYLGGVDPRNVAPNEYTIGFVNETCVIKYKDMEFVWREVENVYRPYLRIHELEYPIFNLHFHSKELHYFILYS